MRSTSNPQVRKDFFDIYRDSVNKRKITNINIKLPQNQLITHLTVVNNKDIPVVHLNNANF